MSPRHLAAALALAILLCLLGVGLALVRAEEPEDAPRFTPGARGDRPAVLEPSEVLDLAAQAFGPELADRVARVAWCESRHRPGARSAGFDRLFGWFDYVGLLQIERRLWAPLAAALTGSDDLTDPWVNLVTGRAILERQGWTAWPVCGR